MKSYVKLFEEYLLEKDPLADLDLDLGDEKKKEKDPLADLDLDAEKDKEKEKEKNEDPFKKEKDAAKKKEERIEKKHDEYVDRKKDKIEDLLQDYPEVDKELGDKIIDAVNSQDRVKIHNAFNDLMALCAATAKLFKNLKQHSAVPAGMSSKWCGAATGMRYWRKTKPACCINA